VPSAPESPVLPDARHRLLEAAVRAIRTQGYSATSVDSLCRAAGVTKGAFFHHFSSKDALAVAVARHWSDRSAALFASAPYHRPEDPLDRVLAYVDFRTDLLAGAVQEFTCLAGTLVQEAWGTSDEIRAACDASIAGHAETLVADIEAARERHGVRSADWDAGSLALHTQAVLQGAFILAKCKGGPEVARDMAAHLKRYIQLLFGRNP
jgi:TetR/AcrR family transcriptional repressor of nem operon